MSALLGEPTILDDVDLINFSDRGEAMGTVDYCFAPHDLIQFTHNSLFSVSVQVASRFIEQEYFGLRLQEASCNQDSLAFATR